MDHCKVNSRPFSFGEYSAIYSKAKRSHSKITVQCSGSGNYALVLSEGLGTFTQRKLSSPTDSLFYNIYTDYPMARVWGDGTGNTVKIYGAYTSKSRGKAVNHHTIFGSIFPQQDAEPGQYQDNLHITLIF